MKERIVLLLSGFLAWISYFLIARALFLVYHHELAGDLALTDLLLTFVHGVRMDMAMAGYLSLLPGLFFAFLFFLNGRSLWKIWFGYHIVALVIVTFIIVLDFELYKHWGFRMDATPLLYIGKEAAGSGDPLTSLLLISYWLLIVALSCFALFKLFRARFFKLERIQWSAVPAFIFITALFILPIRGSLGVAPMNTGFVFFHQTNMFANHTAVNVVWNFLYGVSKLRNLRYADKYFDKDKTETYLKAMYPQPDSTLNLLRTKRPNVLLIVLESYTASLIKSLGGLDYTTPRINEFVKEGVLFDHFYSSGDRTEKGAVAILNAYPAQPVTSINKDPKKTQHLPYLSQVFKANGYRTEFTYGYNINYVNFNSYLNHAQFDHITHSLDFPQELNTSKWGVHDHYVFDKFFDEAQACSQPFFKMMMTQSSHEPFVVPMETVIKGEDEVNMFLNSAYYTDKSLGDFIDKARKTSWWENTLIVVTADHGHIYPNNPGVSNPDRYRIPLLFLGGALAVRDTVIHTIGGQTDIANTILGQLGLYSPEFTFSHNMLAKSTYPFAVFAYNNGFGMIKPNGIFVYDNVAKKIVQKKGDVSETDLDEGMSYMQKLYWDFNSR